MKGPGTENARVSLFMPISRASTAANKTGAWRFMRPDFREKTAPCAAACPCGQDIPRIEMLVSRGMIAEAWRTLLSENPLPGICGRVCFRPCEAACNRREIDEAVSVNALERFIDESATRLAIPEESAATEKRRERIAIIGSGPAGLSAAYFLGRLGYGCDVLEAGSGAGGALRTGIPAYRLPQAVLDRELARVEAAGARFVLSRKAEADFLTTARAEYDAVFVACGHGKSASLGIAGAELAEDGLDFLASVKNGAGKAAAGSPRKALVIGGGNTAVDVARSLRRLGAESIIVYRRREADMPAFREEIERALAEGVRVVDLASPLDLTRGESGLRLRVRKMRTAGIGDDGRMRVVPVEGEIETLMADAVYSAIGAGPAEPWTAPPEGSSATARPAATARSATTAYGHCAALWSSAAGLPILFGGDSVNETESVADAVASGKQAAIALDVYFKDGAAAVAAELERCRVGGGAVSMEIHRGGIRSARSSEVVRTDNLNRDYVSPSSRRRGSSLAPDIAIASFAEAEAALTDADAATEAERCLNCGICNDCDNCRTFCPEAAVRAGRAERPGNGDRTDRTGPDRSVDEDYCKGCGICAAECPRGVMAIEEQRS